MHECFGSIAYGIWCTCVLPGTQEDAEDFHPIKSTIPWVIKSRVLDNNIVFIVGVVEAPVDLQDEEARRQADATIRNRIVALASDMDTSGKVPPKMYAVCAFGKYVAYYTFDRASGEIVPPQTANGEAPSIEQWHSNVVDDAGRLKFQAMVDNVKAMIAEKVNAQRESLSASLSAYGSEIQRTHIIHQRTASKLTSVPYRVYSSKRIFDGQCFICGDDN